MDLTAGHRATAVGAALVVSAGLASVTYGIAANDLPSAVGGAIFAVCALTLIALVVIRRWVTDTTAERRRLDDAVRAADDDRMRYTAALAGVEVERSRLRRDAAAAEHQLAARLNAERAALDEQFEEARAQLIVDTTVATLELVERGFPNISAADLGARIIGFPTAGQRTPADEPARGHGATRV